MLTFVFLRKPKRKQQKLREINFLNKKNIYETFPRGASLGNFHVKRGQFSPFSREKTLLVNCSEASDKRHLWQYYPGELTFSQRNVMLNV